MSAGQLQERLVWSQTDLAMARSLVDLHNHRLAGAMEQICYYKSLADGAVGIGDRETVWLEQLANSQQAIELCEARNKALQEQLLSRS